MIRIALPALLIALLAAAGCWGRSGSEPSKSVGADAAKALDLDKLWPQEQVAKLAPDQRQQLLEQSLAGLKGNNWRSAQDVLISLGRDSGPPLIDLVSSQEPSAASEGPIPSAKVKTLGELAHDTLLLLVQNRSPYRGELPARDPDAWKRWWAANSASVASKG